MRPGGTARRRTMNIFQSTHSALYFRPLTTREAVTFIAAVAFFSWPVG